MEIVRKIACLVLSFIICVCVVCSVLGVSVVFLLSSKGYWVKCADSVNYYSRTAIEIEDQSKAYSVPSGIPKWVFEGIVSEEKIKSDVVNQISSAKDGGVYSLNKEETKNEFLSAFEKYAVDNGYEMTDELKENLDGLADICADEYNSHVSMAMCTLIMRYAVSYKKTLFVLIAVALLIMMFAVVVLVLNKRRRSLVYISYSAGGAALMLIAPAVLVYIYKIFSRFYFKPEYMYDFIVKLMVGVVEFLSCCSALVLVLCIVFAVIGMTGKRKEQKNSEETDLV